MRKLFVAALLIVTACSEPLAPIAPSEALAAKGGIKGPNRPYFVLSDYSTHCYFGFPECDFMVAGLRKPDVLTVTQVSTGQVWYDCRNSDGEFWDVDEGVTPSTEWVDSATFGPVTGSKSYGGWLGVVGVYPESLPCPEGYAQSGGWDAVVYKSTLTAVTAKDTVSITFYR